MQKKFNPHAYISTLCLFLLTQMYIYSGKISPPHKNFFSGLLSFFYGELMKRQKIREKVPCPLKEFVHTKNQSEMAGAIFCCWHIHISNQKKWVHLKKTFSLVSWIFLTQDLWTTRKYWKIWKNNMFWCYWPKNANFVEIF